MGHSYFCMYIKLQDNSVVIAAEIQYESVLLLSKYFRQCLKMVWSMWCVHAVNKPCPGLGKELLWNQNHGRWGCNEMYQKFSLWNLQVRERYAKVQGNRDSWLPCKSLFLYDFFRNHFFRFNLFLCSVCLLIPVCPRSLFSFFIKKPYESEILHK